MLTGKNLGKAIAKALELKGVSKADVAKEFKIKPPSVSGWIATGRISKPNFEKLRQYVADKVGPEHWGLSREHEAGVKEPAETTYNSLADDEKWLVLAFRKAPEASRVAMLALAQTILPDRPTVFTKRTET